MMMMLMLLFVLDSGWWVSGLEFSKGQGRFLECDSRKVRSMHGNGGKCRSAGGQRDAFARARLTPWGKASDSDRRVFDDHSGQGSNTGRVVRGDAEYDEIGGDRRCGSLRLGMVSKLSLLATRRGSGMDPGTEQG